jgi:Ca2+-binding RTX toxin-like protein
MGVAMTIYFYKPHTVNVLTVPGHGGICTGDGQNDFIYGSTGDDTIYGGGGDDQIVGGGGDDVIYGGSGDVWITLGGGQNTVYGGSGQDFISAGGSNDLIMGGSGDDWIKGGSGDDRLYGGGGSDFIEAGKGNSALSGGQGNDTLLGGSGLDQFHWSAADFTHPTGSSDLVIGFHAGDTVNLHGILTQAALDAAIASPRTAVPVGEANAGGVTSVTITYGNDPTSYVNPVNNQRFHDAAALLDTHVQFTSHGNVVSDIWFWDVQLQQGDFVIT